MKHETLRTCVVSLFSHEAFFMPLSHLRQILVNIYPGSKSLIAVSPELIDKIPFDFEKDAIIVYRNQNNAIFRILNYLYLNLKISWHIFFKSKDTDCFIFFIETGLLLPMIAGKLRNKKIIWLLPSSLEKLVEHRNDFLNFNLLLQQSLSYAISDNIILYSSNLMNEWKLRKYSDKILIAHEHYIDVNIFNERSSLSHRPFMIGYIGRLVKRRVF